MRKVYDKALFLTKQVRAQRLIKLVSLNKMLVAEIDKTTTNTYTTVSLYR
jgi:hypothetical protein